MIELIFHYLAKSKGMDVPSVFSYISVRMMCAAVTSLLLVVILGPKVIQKLYGWKIGQKIRKEECPLLGELHAKKENTPTMGGALILISMLFSLLLWMDLFSIYTQILALTTLSLGLLGGYDDYLKLKFKNSKGLSAKKKFVCQTLVALLISLYFFVPGIHETIETSMGLKAPTIKEWTTGESQEVPLEEAARRVYVPFLKNPLFVFPSLLALLLFLLVIVGASNGVNLTDGLDGLAAGCLIFVALSLAGVAFVSNHVGLAKYLNLLYIEGSGEIAIYLSAFCGACLGFLWFNGHPAQVFMGDTGSLALGGILGVSAVLLKRELLLAIIGGIFVVEALSVILQVGSYKLRGKKRLFLCAPLHHHFEYKGIAEPKVVLRFWIVGFLLAVIGLMSLKFQ